MARSEGIAFDTELADLPQALRWRTWMGRIEAVLFASAEPVGRDTLAGIVGRECSIDLLIEDISSELNDRPYEIARVAGGWQFRTRTGFSDAIRAVRGNPVETRPLSPTEGLVLTAIAYLQPVTRGEISRMMGREVSRDVIGRLHRNGFIARGPRSPEPGAPYTYVTTAGFLEHFGLDTLRDLPDMEALEDAGLLQKDGGGISDMLVFGEEREATEEDTQ
ncbi:SMC-Scp complex subunit ScpB [Paracoccus sp. IB05]|uniref:SMC-Scp complex subunit ScpB n=1 Tax=Paracoccus sp. IB05 TaxID=2779367 RepID=UPI0018E7DF47|nr:SMC-Scp complex subunit ScpB [Paracoccus sp. IB05]MBJ2153016.1 SMC-Scp complex subunit ScpB [Paracoccus sp. IB05]